MKKNVLVIAAFCIYSSLGAQQKWKFSSQNYAGITEGQSGTAFQLQTINGFRYKTWLGGIGTGLDYYYIRSIPLFASLNKFFATGKGSFYLNYDIGINFPWEGRYYSGLQSGDGYSSGLYWAGGLGYKFSFKKQNEGILLNLGYSYKHLASETEYTNPCLFPPCPVDKERYDYHLRRLSVKVGWMF